MSLTLEAVVHAELDAAGFDLVELRQGGSKSRPLIEIRIDPEGITPNATLSAIRKAAQSK